MRKTDAIEYLHRWATAGLSFLEEQDKTENQHARQMIEMARVILKESDTPVEWHHVNETLPETSHTVLVALDDGRVASGYCTRYMNPDGTEVPMWRREGHGLRDVSFWAEMPRHPMEKV